MTDYNHEARPRLGCWAISAKVVIGVIGVCTKSIFPHIVGRGLAQR